MQNKKNSNWDDLVGVIRLSSPLVEQKSWDVIMLNYMKVFELIVGKYLKCTELTTQKLKIDS